MNLQIGTSGWSYNHWRESFYPPELSKKAYLTFYASVFSTVEINNSFYRLPSTQTFRNWYDRTPGGFVFAVKASRYITHVKKLAQADDAWNRFYRNAVELREKLGPVLFQFPPNWGADVDRLVDFLKILPPEVRVAFEFRHPGWFDSPVYAALEQAGAAMCQTDSPDWPKSEMVTAPFVFMRMHGGRLLYGSRYDRSELETLAERIAGYLAERIDVYVYFNNDANAHAVVNAKELIELLGRRGFEARAAA